jgi:flagellar FliL protein
MISRDDEQQVSKKNQRSLWILAIVAFISISACTYMYFIGFKDSSAQVSARDVKTVTLPSITVNLADTDSSRYLKTTITLEFYSDDVEEELNDSMYKVKDGILKVLRNTKANTMEDTQQTEVLKKALLSEINSRLKSGKITGLYFQELLVQ